MKIYQKLRSSTHPQDIEVTADRIIIASDVTEYEEVIDGHII
jgi:hypothetical protein